MKKAFYRSLCLVVFFAACKNAVPQQQQQQIAFTHIPAIGDIVATDSMTIRVDAPVNEFKFNVKVVAASSDSAGLYNVVVNCGPDSANGQFYMPKHSGQVLIPVIRKADTANTFIIGFRMGKDTVFNDYYQVTGGKSSIEMKYIQTYTFKNS